MKLAEGFLHQLADLEDKLVKEFYTIFIQEESYWHQKSCTKWIAKGERNTRYFHNTTIIRGRRNKIIRLRDGNDEWTEDEETLKMIAGDFYANMYRAEPSQTPTIISFTFPKLNRVNLRLLNRAIFEPKIKAVVSQMRA